MIEIIFRCSQFVLVSGPELKTSARPLDRSTAKTRSSTRSSKAKGVTCTKLNTEGVCVFAYICLGVCVYVSFVCDLNY